MATTDTPRHRARPKAAAAAATLVLMVRHGTTPTTGQVLPGRARGLHLSEAGRAQAEAVAARLAELKKPPTALYCSPLERTKETAAPIAKALGLEVVTNRGLLECDFGDWTGAELKELVKKPEWTTVQRYPSGFKFPGGESFTAMQSRMVDTVLELSRHHLGSTIVAVSHADPIKAVVAAGLGTHLDLFQRIVISPCSVTAISYGSSGPSVLAVNSTSSLSELQPS